MEKLGSVPTSIGKILETDNENSLIKAIKENSVYGFIECDVETPEEIRKAFGSFLFPPVIQRMDLDESNISPYMKQRINEEGKNLNFSTVVQTYSGKKIFLLTSLAKFYLEKGLIISNITKFIQYQPGRALLPFQQKVYNMRVEATKANDEAKSTVSKLFGNSGKT